MIWRRKKTIFLTGLLIIFLFVVIVLPTFLPGTFNKIGNTLWKVKDGGSGFTAAVSGIFSSKSSLIKETRELKNEINTLKRQVLLQSVLEKKLSDLEEILEIKEETATAARVLSRPPQSPYDTFVIERGLRDGIKKGDKIYAEENFIIGRVVETQSQTSKVRLLSNPGEIVEIELGDGVYTEAIGRGGGNFIIEIPREVDVEENDSIILPGSNLTVLGFVEEIESRAKDPFQKIYFSLPVNLNELRWVLIYPE